MKTHIILMAALCLAAVGCRNHGKYFTPYEGGLSPDEVRRTMAADNCDMALILGMEDRQVVLYAHSDNPLLCCLVTDSLGSRQDTASYAADADWHFAPLKGGTWRLRHPDVEALSYNVKAARIGTSAEGVHFDLRRNVVTRARCLFLASDPSLLTDTLFASPAAQALLQYAIFTFVDDDRTDTFDLDTSEEELFVDPDDYDEAYLDSVRAENRRALEAAEQALLAVEAGLDSPNACRYHLEALGKMASDLGFNHIQVHHRNGPDGKTHQGCTFRAIGSPCPSGKCYDRMASISELANATGLSWSISHHASRSVHKSCVFACE